MSDPSADCRYLEWDSSFFGRRIGRITGPRLTRIAADRAREWVGRESIECLYYLADSADAESVRAAEDVGFRLVDVRVTLSRALAPDEWSPTDTPPDEIGPFTPEDVPALRSIARTSHRDTRFYYDPHFPRERCDALYERWIEKSCAGHADAVLVARAQGHPVGYVACHLGPDDTGQIGLIALDATTRGQGLGERLVRASLCWFAGNEARRTTVATQGRNIHGLRLYEKLGFRTDSVQLWYHLWPSESRLAAG